MRRLAALHIPGSPGHPIVMKPGAYDVYAFRIDGNKMTLRQVRNVRGPLEGGNIITLTRVQ